MKKKIYISARTYGRLLPETILAIAAYHKVAGTTELLQCAAEDGLRYCLATKCRIEEGWLLQLHHNNKAILSDGQISEAEQMRFAMTTLRSFEERLSYLQEHRETIRTHMKADELEKFLGTMLQGASRAGEKEKLVHLRKELDVMGYKGDILRQVDGNLILTLNSAINTFMPVLSKLKLKSSGKNADLWQKVQHFKELLDRGDFIRLQSQAAVKLKAFIIDVYEEDIEATEDAVRTIFSEIEWDEGGRAGSD